MNLDYARRYGKKPVIGVYTNGPENITDSADLWTIKYLGPLDSELTAVTTIEPNYLVRQVVRVHDRNLHPEYDHILYVINSESVDLTYLANWLDLESTTFIEKNYKFALYRRDLNYQIKTIDFGDFNTLTNTSSSSFLKNLSGDSVGVIFIDCWPVDFVWQHSHDAFNFYQHMLNKLSQYKIDSYVFHTSFMSLDVITPEIANYIRLVAQQTNTQLMQNGIKELINSTGDERLASELQSLTMDPKSVFIPGLHGFDAWRQHTGINQWLVVGMHWGICTHEKPLGFYNLKKIKDQNPLMKVFSLPECTARWIVNSNGQRIARLCNKSDYDNDSLEWSYYGDIAQLM